MFTTCFCPQVAKELVKRKIYHLSKNNSQVKYKHYDRFLIIHPVSTAAQLGNTVHEHKEWILP